MVSYFLHWHCELFTSTFRMNGSCLKLMWAAKQNIWWGQQITFIFLVGQGVRIDWTRQIQLVRWRRYWSKPNHFQNSTSRSHIHIDIFNFSIMINRRNSILILAIAFNSKCAKSFQTITICSITSISMDLAWYKSKMSGSGSAIESAIIDVPATWIWNWVVEFEQQTHSTLFNCRLSRSHSDSNFSYLKDKELRDKLSLRLRVRVRVRVTVSQTKNRSQNHVYWIKN